MKKVFTTLVLLLACAAMSFAAGKTIYLNPGVWDVDNATERYALYMFVDNTTNEWVDFTQIGTSGIYKATLKDGYTGILCRMNGEAEENKWDNKWNQSIDLSPTTDTYYNITAWGDAKETPTAIAMPSSITVAGQMDISSEYKNWNQATMTDKGDLTYELKIENQKVYKGSYGYKIVVDSDWKGDPNNSNANWQLEIPASGVYRITYTYNWVTGAISGTAEKTGDASLTKKYTVKEYGTSYSDLGEMTIATEGDDAGKTAAYTLTGRTSSSAGEVLKYKIVEQLFEGETEVWNIWRGSGDKDIDENYNLGVTLPKASIYNVTFNIWFSSESIWTDVEEQFTGYNLITNEGEEDKWIKGSALTKDGGAYSISFSKAGKMFAIAPNTAFDASDDITSWANVVRPVTAGDDWAVNYFVNYSGTTQISEGGKVWAVAEGNTSTLTLTYTPAANTFAITTDAKETVTIAAGNDGYATFSTNTGDYQIADVDVYIVSAAETSATLTKLAADESIPAGTGVIINGAVGSHDVTPKAAAASNADVSKNLLVGSNAYTYDITGNFGEGANPYYDGYVLANSTNGVGFYKVSKTSNNTLAAHKAFLAANRRAAQASALTVLDFIGFGISNPTAIEDIEVAKEGVKNAFNLAGQRVARPTKGLYIVNGKKVVLK